MLWEIRSFLRDLWGIVVHWFLFVLRILAVLLVVGILFGSCGAEEKKELRAEMEWEFENRLDETASFNYGEGYEDGYSDGYAEGYAAAVEEFMR